MLDEIDRALVHALQVDGRAPFSRIATVLGVSTQTVTRRYQRLRELGLRVVGLADPEQAGQAQWLLRLTATPRNAQDVARALARRPDTSWVKLASGGTEIAAIVRTPQTDSAGHPLFLQDIPATAAITAVSAHYLLHVYLGGPTAWTGRAAALTPAQQAALTWSRDGRAPSVAPTPGGIPGPGRAAEAVPAGGGTGPGEPELLAALGRDGRTSLAGLATATGLSPATITRRLAGLRATGGLYFDVELDATHLGVTTQALLWMTVSPARLDQVATALAGHGELAFVAATTGATNLVAHALCTSPSALHDYLIHRLGGLKGVLTVETAPVLRTLKAAGHHG